MTKPRRSMAIVALTTKWLPWQVLIVAALLRPSGGYYNSNQRPTPMMNFYKGFIDAEAHNTPYTESWEMQPYTMEIYMETYERYDFVIEKCTYGNAVMIDGGYGCSADPSKYTVEEIAMNRKYDKIRRVMVLFYADVKPLSAIHCTVRVLQCNNCAEKVCKCQTDLKQYTSWQVDVSRRYRSPSYDNGVNRRSGCVGCWACDFDCAPKPPPPTPTPPPPPPLTTTTTTTTTTMRPCPNPPCPCYGTNCISPCIGLSCGGVAPIAPFTADVMITCASCAPFAFGCAWRCMRCDGCPAGVYYPWYSLVPWWIWLLLALIPLLLLLCCCLPWFIYLLSNTPFFRRREKAPTAMPNIVVPHTYDKAPQRIICADKNVQTNVAEPRTAALRYCGDYVATDSRRVEESERLTSRKEEERCRLTDFSSRTAVAQPDESARLELGDHASISLCDVPPAEASGGIYLKKNAQSESRRAPLARPDNFNGTDSATGRTRHPVPYTGRWESYESEEIKESIVDENRRIADDLGGSTQFGVNQRHVPIQLAADGDRNAYENYRPSIAPPPYPSSASTHNRHNRTTSVPRPTRLPPLGGGGGGSYAHATSYGDEIETSTLTRQPRSRSAQRDYRYDTAVSPTYANGSGSATTPQVVFSSDSYPATSSEEMYREELIRTTRQSSAL